MNWAAKRQAIAIAILVGIVLLLVAIGAFFFLYTPASCIDKKQNQDETGIDCGGSCTTLCVSEALPARIRFVRVLTPVEGRSDIVAYIDNPNENAEARDVHLTIELYSAAQVRLGSTEVALDLPALSSVPLFMPSIGDGTAAKAFMSFVGAGPVWTKTTQKAVLPVVKDTALQNTNTPRITASLVNPVAKPLRDITIVATVFDESNNAIAATQTFVTELPSQGTVPIVFTWNAPFPATPVRYDVVPVPSL